MDPFVLYSVNLQLMYLLLIINEALFVINSFLSRTIEFMIQLEAEKMGITAFHSGVLFEHVV